MKSLCGWLVLHLVLAGFLAAQQSDCSPECVAGQWSQRAFDMSSGGSTSHRRDKRASSPDGRKSIHHQENKWWVEIDGRIVSIISDPDDIDLRAEAAWAPDSKAFYITHSAGSTTGFHAHVYRLRGDAVQEIAGMSERVVERFEMRHKCFSDSPRGDFGSPPNVAGVHWVDGSSRLLLVAEVPNVGICEQMNYFGGYLIDLHTERIVGRYSPLQLIRKWPSVLGDVLRGDFKQLTTKEKSMIP